MTHLEALLEIITAAAGPTGSAEMTNTAFAQFLVDAGVTVPAVEEPEHEFIVGDYVRVLKNGDWLDGRIVETNDWGNVEVDTAKGPVSVIAGGYRLRLQVAPVTKS